ncbi:MAG: outer membrane lipid asymmetry maintenance protein MlaD [Deltaproteobacteria bacterium]|nr:outer membrane lipid asymmetry maintenance protein MlaD [Deltaproteobacteria bacterium]
MDQLESNNKGKGNGGQDVVLPKRSFSVEFWVGVFSIAALACAAYLAMGLGDFELFGSDKYNIYAEFDNISGLQMGASVEVAGVKIGQVSEIKLDDPVAVITLRIEPNIKIREDDIASIRTKGIIGDRYVKISRGSSEAYVPKNGRITETESIVDIEDIIGKIVHNLSGGSDKESE